MTKRPSEPDVVTQQLRKLREGQGLTRVRLEQSGAVMSALGSGDPIEALERLQQILGSLGDSDRYRALLVDYGVRLDALLEREPVVRERDWLGDRRSAYAEQVGRGVKTLARWSDAAVLDLRAALLDDTFTGHVYVVGSLVDGRLEHISVVYEDAGQSGSPTQRRTQDFVNPSMEASIPMMIYAIPRDWSPTSLRMALVVRSGELPASATAVVSETLIEMPFGEERADLKFEGGVASCQFEPVRRDRVYALAW